MNQMDFEKAVRLIVRTDREYIKRNSRHTYAFVVGAGISFPPVPLASQIEDYCRSEAKALGSVDSAPTDAPIDRYSFWFQEAFPNLGDRQRYLSRLIEDRPVSPANIRLAQILVGDVIANTVITPNFDDFLARALALLGSYKARICDHPGTVERVDADNKGIQIVHVHGTYWFYDLANLKNEIASRAKHDPSSIFSMAQLLDTIFRTHSPLVVGYSGWDGDVIMSALKRRLSGRFENLMFWFCHEKGVLANLPEWLRNHEDVIFVLPPESRPIESDRAPHITISDAANTSPEIDSSLENRTVAGIESYQSTTQTETKLEARTVFERIVTEAKLQAPLLLREPLEFFEKQLKDFMFKGSESGSVNAAFSFDSVIRRVENARKLEQAARVEESALESIRDSLRRANYVQALTQARDLRFDGLTREDTTEIIKALSDAASNVHEDYDVVLESLDKLIRQVDLVAKPKPSASEYDLIARLILTKARIFRNLDKHKEVIGACEEFISRPELKHDPLYAANRREALLLKAGGMLFEKQIAEALGVADEVIAATEASNDETARGHLARALFAKANALGELKQTAKAVEIYDEIITRFGSSNDPGMASTVAKVLVNMGYRLGELNRTEDELNAYNEVLTRFGRASDTAVRNAVAMALSNKAAVQHNLGQTSEALASCDEVIERVSRDDSSNQRPAARALHLKVRILSSQDRFEDAASTYRELLDRLEGAKNRTDLLTFAQTMVNYADLLRKRKLAEKQLEVYDTLIARFDGSRDELFFEVVTRALLHKAITSISLNRVAEGLAVSENIINRHSNSQNLDLLKHVAYALQTKARALCQTARTQEALAAYRELVRKFGSSTDKYFIDLVVAAQNAITQIEAFPQKNH